MRGVPSSLEDYGTISFWGSQNTFLGSTTYPDIPIDYRVTLNCLIQNNHNLIPYLNLKRYYENDAEIGFMYGRGFGDEVNLEEANYYFQQAYERANDSIAEFNNYYANLAKADVLIRTAKKDTLEALDLIATAMNTSAENILNGNFPQTIIFKGYKPIDPFDCGYSWRGVGSFISLCSSIDLGNILWYGCKSFEPNKTAALEVFKRIKDANDKDDGLPHLHLSNALIDIYNKGYKEDEIINLILESSTIGAQSRYQEYRSNCAYSLASLYMFVKPLRNLKKAEFYLKEAKRFKHPIMKEKVKNAYNDLKRLKKEAKK